MKETIENNYKCAPAIWKKFSDKQKIAYKNIRFIGKLDITSHPDAKISPNEWNTISHNFACLGAWEIK